MTRGPGSTGDPEDIDAAFAEIVAGLRRDSGAVPSWPQDERSDEEPGTTKPRRTERERREEEPPARPEMEPAPVEPEIDEGHFEPPEPPPLPRLRRSTIGALVMFAIGLFLLIVPGVVGLTRQVGLPLGLLIISGGVGWLVYRMRQGPPPDSGWHDGAQV